MIPVKDLDPDLGRIKIITDESVCRQGRKWGWVIKASFKAYPGTRFFLMENLTDYTKDEKQAGVWNDIGAAKDMAERCRVNYVDVSVLSVYDGEILSKPF